VSVFFLGVGIFASFRRFARRIDFHQHLHRPQALWCTHGAGAGMMDRFDGQVCAMIKPVTGLMGELDKL
jgi:hypothetical protein